VRQPQFPRPHGVADLSFREPQVIGTGDGCRFSARPSGRDARRGSPYIGLLDAAQVTYHAVRAITLCSHRVYSMVSPLHPREQVESQAMPPLAEVVRPELVGPRVRICDRDRSRSTTVQPRLHTPDVPRIRAPVVTLNCVAHPPRFVPSSQEACVKRVISLDEGDDRPTPVACVTPHHRGRNYQDLGNELLDDFRGQHAHVAACRQRAA